MSNLLSLPTETLIAMAVGLSAFLVVLFIWQALVVRDPKSKRLKSILIQQNRLKKQSLQAQKSTFQRPEVLTFMSNVVAKLNVLKTREAEKMVDELAQAGFRSREALNAFFFFRFALPFVFAALAALWLYVLHGDGQMQPLTKAFVMIGATVFGIYAPKLYIKNTATKRKEALQKALPDALDLLVVCAEAGLSLDMALKRVSKEMMGPNPEMAEELGMTAMELGFLPNRSDALRNLNKRTDLQGLRAVVSTLNQSERYGTPLAQSLRVLSAEFRTERMLKAEEKAAKLPATLTVPMIIFIMPALFIVLLGPAIIRAIEVFPDF